MILLIAVAVGVGIYLYASPSSAAPATTPESDTGMGYGSLSSLPDVLQNEQGGSWTRLYDDAFSKSGDKWGVPFALLKAHAIRESALDAKAYRLEPSGKASYGLMQILWWPGSNRFSSYGYNDDLIRDGSPLYDPYPNTTIAAQLIRDNFNRFGNLRDTINAYNTGVAESVRIAPGNYVDDVLKYYSKLVNKTV